MDEIWISGVSGLVGALIGGGLSVLTAWWARSWQKEDRDEQEAQAVRMEVRQRAVSQAEAILTDLRALNDLLSRRIILSHVDVVAQDDERELRQLLSRIAVANAYLTSPTRELVGTVPRLLPDASRLAGERWVEDSAQVLSRVTVWHAQAAVEGFIRGEQPPLEDPKVKAYLEAQRSLNEWIDQDIERQIAEAEENQALSDSASSPEPQ